MNQVSVRLRRRIEREYGMSGAVEVCRIVAEAAESERVQAAIVLAARGDLREIHNGAALAVLDWRDVLVNGGLANLGWGERMDAELGPAGP